MSRCSQNIVRGIAGLVLLLSGASAAFAGAALQAGDAAGTEASYQPARQRYERAMGELVRQRALAIKAAQASPEYEQTARQVQLAYDRYNQVEQTAIARLQIANPNYQELLRQVDAAAAQIDKARGTPGATPETFARLYEKKASLTAEKMAMEDRAVAASDAESANAEWSAASKALENLNAQIASRIENEPAVASAKNELEAASAEVDKTGAAMARAKAEYQRASYEQAQQDYLRARQAEYLETRYWGYGNVVYPVGWYASGRYRYPERRVYGTQGSPARR